jgi:Tol biopolymer transport system component
VALASGTRLGPYEILSAIGAGGMGEVYRAGDTKLNRDVALKILPDAFALDGDRIARFRREAQVLASLNHPNIAAIHGFEDSGSTHALVLELVEGPTLADRIAKGPIPLDEALPIAKQIAEALEAAHEQGIIHRDLKPANIKVRDDGTVKVLDFGLAKALEPASAISPALTASPTITTPVQMTGIGTLLGTAAYMSPEQAKGRPADKRSDIWAFGCVLYEMLTGTQAFAGSDVGDTLAAVLRGDPDWATLPTATAPSIRRLLRRCLAKDRTRRLADTSSLKLEIDEAINEPRALPGGVAMDAAPRTRWRAIAISMLSTTVAVALTVLATRVVWPPHVPPARSVIRLELDLPAGVELHIGGQSVALSPDGTHLAFIGVLNGVRQIYVRRLDQFEAVPLRGTEGANVCFFSPDERALAFIIAGGGLKRVSLADGLVVPLAADVDFSAGGAWGLDDRITFGRAGTLWQVPATGAAVVQVTRFDQGRRELSHRWPTVVAEGHVILFTVVTGSGRAASRIEALTVATGQRRVLLDAGVSPLYAASGHLVFGRDDALLAAPFDVNRLAVTGPFRRMVENVALDSVGAPIAALSTAGALVYATRNQAASQLVWVSRQGSEQPLTDTPRRYLSPRLSPDGRSVLVTADSDLWIQDTTRATFTRLTPDDTTGGSWANWTPDGARVVFRTATGLRWIAADGSGRTRAIPGTSANDFPISVSPDGSTLAFTRLTDATSADVYVLSLTGDPQPRAIVSGPAYEGGGQFSPDGRWLAYVSDESGQFEVYLRPFPGPGRRSPVSTQGGTHPRWNPNGKELFYRNGAKMMAVEITTVPTLVLSPPQLLFEQRYAYGASVATGNFDVSRDGQRFVMVKDDSVSGRVSVVANWFTELQQRVPTR